MNAISTQAYEYLIKEMGSEDKAKDSVEKYIAGFGGIMPFEAGVAIKAAEHGWENPNRPKAVYVTHLSDNWLREYVEYKAYGSKAYGNTDFEGVIAAIGPVQDHTYTDKDNRTVTKTYIDVRLEDEGWERTVRMYDHDPFVSSKGDDIRGSYMLTLFDNIRAAVGKRMLVRQVKVVRSENFRGVTYAFESSNFTDARLVDGPQKPEEMDLEDEDF